MPRPPALRAKALLLTCCVSVAFLAVDVLLGMRHSGSAVGGRVVTCLALAGLALLERRLSSKAGERFMAVMAFAIGAGVCLTTFGMGGSASLHFNVLFALPLLLTALAPDRPLAPIACGAALVVGGALILVHDGRRPQAVVAWMIGEMFVTAVAAYGAILYSRLVALELAAERERTVAVQSLAESERRRAMADRLAIVGRLASGVAHEVNNPLAYIMSNLEWLRAAEERAGRLSGERLSVFDETRDGLVRIREIVGDLRIFSRDVPDAPGEAEVARAIAEAVRLSSVRYKGIAELVVSVPDDLPRATAQHGRLVQVLVNLIVNASDALEPRSGAESAKQGRIEVTARMSEATIVVEVADDGPGFPPELLSHAFEPFFTTKAPGKGTGLGLALTREYVDRCGGSVTAANRPTGGAILTIHLAAAPVPARALAT